MIKNIFLSLMLAFGLSSCSMVSKIVADPGSVKGKVMALTWTVIGESSDPIKEKANTLAAAQWLLDKLSFERIPLIDLKPSVAQYVAQANWKPYQKLLVLEQISKYESLIIEAPEEAQQAKLTVTQFANYVIAAAEMM